MPTPKNISEETKQLIFNSLSYDASSGILTWKVFRSKVKPGDIAGTRTKAGYEVFTLQERVYKCHRIAWLFITGKYPLNEIDHINGVKFDNRASNLREVTRSQNQHNRKRHRDGNFVGVYLDKEYGGWIASAPRNFLKRKAKKHKYLGYFKSKEEARQAVIDYCKLNEE